MLWNREIYQTYLNCRFLSLSSSCHRKEHCADTYLTKKERVSQLVIPESYVPTILHLINDDILAGHPGRERTLLADYENIY